MMKTSDIDHIKYMERDWGRWDVLQDWKTTKVKTLMVNPGWSLSYQYHNYRSEYWHIVQGYAEVVIDDVLFIMKEQQNITIPVKSWHKVKNIGNKELIITEIQYGEKCLESDIVRQAYMVE